MRRNDSDLQFWSKICYSERTDCLRSPHMSFDRVQFRQPEAEESSSSIPARPNTVTVGLENPEKKREFTKEKGMKMSISRKMVAGVLTLVLLAGAGTGIALSFASQSSSGTPVAVEQDKTAEEVGAAVKAGAVFGVPDEKTFRDEVTGVLIKGGIAGEGSHTLLRDGGVSQNVYLTSSVVDLDQFENMQVRVWGETFKGQKAGWLMDVGRLEVAKVDGEKPSWYKEN